MVTVLEYPHIDASSGVARFSRLPRIRVAQIVVDQMAHGWSAEEILRQYPHLTPAEVHAALAYYFDHRAAIDAEIRREWSEAERAASEGANLPLAIRLRAAAAPA